VFSPGKNFQDNTIFVGKAGAYPSETPFRCSTLSRSLALLTNNRLGWKGLPGANTLVYWTYNDRGIIGRSFVNTTYEDFMLKHKYKILIFRKE
jgi:hypothetical protein